jgi:predicted metalloprotease with PDZ domain
VLGAACSAGPGSSPAGAPVVGAGPGGPLLYEVTPHDGGARLSVAVAVPPGLPADFHVESSMTPWLRGAEIETPSGWEKVPFGAGAWTLPGCAGGCRVRYEVDLAGAASGSGEVGYAAEHAGAYLAPPTTWLLHPAAELSGVPFRFHVARPEGIGFITGLLPVEGAESTYGADLSDLPEAPYSAFGKLEAHRLEHARGKIEIAFANSPHSSGNSLLLRWIEESARAVSGYYGRFPMSHAAVIVLLEDGPDIGFATALGNGGGSIVARVGREVPERRLLHSWQMTHEMLHLAFPNLPRRHRWFEEGMATYVEPIARARAGALTEEEVWRDMVKGMPQGLPLPGEGGLDDTPTWGRIYWGGALFCLLADVKIREVTGNVRSLDDALRAVLNGGGNVGVRWPIERVIEVGDRATGTTVLRDLHAEMGRRAVQVDLAALWARLGVRRIQGAFSFDDTAPLAVLRRSITAPPTAGPEN